jgi:hypothetical protein
MAKKDKKSIELPEVKDIPGQEHVRPPRLGELADTTESSADEEGDEVFDQKDDELIRGKSNVTPDERRTLAGIDTHQAYSEDEVLNESALDNTDNDGDPLNEGGFGRGLDEDVDGEDLDVPGSDEDEADEEIGEEDEENHEYSLSDADDHEEREDI